MKRSNSVLVIFSEYEGGNREGRSEEGKYSRGCGLSIVAYREDRKARTNSAW